MGYKDCQHLVFSQSGFADPRVSSSSRDERRIRERGRSFGLQVFRRPTAEPSA